MRADGSPLGNLGSVLPCAWLRFHRLAGVWCKSSPCPPPRPVSTTAAALGLGPSLAATAVPRLASASWWAGGRGWRVTSP